MIALLSSFESIGDSSESLRARMRSGYAVPSTIVKELERTERASE
jgi:hypothetical protein